MTKAAVLALRGGVLSGEPVLPRGTPQPHCCRSCAFTQRPNRLSNQDQKGASDVVEQTEGAEHSVRQQRQDRGLALLQGDDSRRTDRITSGRAPLRKAPAALCGQRLGC